MESAALFIVGQYLRVRVGSCFLVVANQERAAANIFLQIGDINERQAQILKMFLDNPKGAITVRDLQDKFMISPTTAKTDITGLLQRGLLAEIAFNKVKRGYIKGDQFDNLVSELEI